MRPWQIEWVARWKIGSKPRIVAEEPQSMPTEFPRPAKNGKSNKNNKMSTVNKKSTEIKTVIIITK
jgi:hypothetical protein